MPQFRKQSSAINKEYNQKIVSLAEFEKHEKKQVELLKVPSKNQFENSSRGFNSIGGSLQLNFDNTMRNLIDDLS